MANSSRFIDGYWSLFQAKLPQAINGIILLMAIDGYSICGYWW